MDQADLDPYHHIEEAVRWMIDVPAENRPTATTSLLKELFSLSIKEAVAAIRRANSIRYGIQPYYVEAVMHLPKKEGAYGNTRGANQNDHSQSVVYENGAAFGTAISPVALQVDRLRRRFPLSSQFARVVALHCLGGRHDGAIPDRVDAAAVWATAHWRSPRPLIPFLKHEFNLSEKEALTALRAASDELQRARR